MHYNPKEPVVSIMFCVLPNNPSVQVLFPFYFFVICAGYRYVLAKEPAEGDAHTTNVLGGKMREEFPCKKMALTVCFH